MDRTRIYWTELQVDRSARLGYDSHQRKYVYKKQKQKDRGTFSKIYKKKERK